MTNRSSFRDRLFLREVNTVSVQVYSLWAALVLTKNSRMDTFSLTFQPTKPFLGPKLSFLSDAFFCHRCKRNTQSHQVLVFIFVIFGEQRPVLRLFGSAAISYAVEGAWFRIQILMVRFLLFNDEDKDDCDDVMDS